MDKLIIEGGKVLEGEVSVSGSKNASLPILAATLLASDESMVENVPHLADVATSAELLSRLGVRITEDQGIMILDARSISSLEATYDVVSKMRASVLVLGPLLARFGKAKVSLPGGCAIGARPIDMHLSGLEQLGAKVTLEHGYVEAEAPAGGLIGNRIVFDIPSVGATENLMMAACLAKGTTVLENAAREPEIEELAQALSTMGARISGAGSSMIQIEGVQNLKGMHHRVAPDRIESGTFIAIAAATRSNLLIRNIQPTHLSAALDCFQKAGCRFSEEPNMLRVMAPDRLKSVDVRTEPYPGFPTDMQAQFMACMSLADGTSHIEEHIWENRFMHTQELLRMGADISMHGNLAVVRGVAQLSGAQVMATDLRASASLIIAALAAEGVSEVSRIYHLDRGYVALEKKLSALGARIQRVTDQVRTQEDKPPAEAASFKLNADY
ncbi:MAG: UDP-N-acetylglucosamine 1-carboxyvinyltransferase [Myxococcaceae bacterium]|nr:UDP-N-acetylglucosamine 1-carboxyvinyltransferase [Myxococcaceae bacterium]MBH2006153.1 UDP-N-acetylglucosamine 1-carboxyvinyltransferase [Myxococcaceae bacterium]